MHVLVAYASRHGATQGIAERIAETLRSAGIDAKAQPVSSVKSAAGYDAFVVGSAAYMFHTDALDAKGRDQKVVAVPKEVPELAETVHAREHRVFFGAYQPDQKPVGFAERFMSFMPAAKKGLPAGDFRNWPEIEAWAAAIANDLRKGVVPSAT